MKKNNTTCTAWDCPALNGGAASQEHEDRYLKQNTPQSMGVTNVPAAAADVVGMQNAEKEQATSS